MILICYEEVEKSMKLFYKVNCLKNKARFVNLVELECCKVNVIRDFNK